MAYDYAGQRCGRAHPAVWAEAGVVLAADLGSGRDDPPAPGAVAHRRSVAALPDGLGRPRVRADVEERIKDSKCGLALRHLPSGHAPVNGVWMWAALLSLNISAWLQSLGGADGEGRRHAKRLRRELICIPARVLRHARRVVLRLSPVQRQGPLLSVWAALQALPSAVP